jgi:hypothetical protein
MTGPFERRSVNVKLVARMRQQFGTQPVFSRFSSEMADFRALTVSGFRHRPA